MPTPKIRGVIFDLGGTLIFSDRGRSEEANAWSATHYLRSQGFRGDADALFRAILEHRSRGTTRLPRQALNRDALREAASSCGFSLTGHLLDEAERAFFRPELASTTPIPGMLEVVKSLHGHVRLALCSNTTSHGFVGDVVSRVGLAGMFDPLMTSARCGWRKPHPGAFEEIARSWGLAERDLLVVGDDPEADVAPAQGLGTHTVWLRTDVRRPWPACSATAHVDDARGLYHLLQEWIPDLPPAPAGSLALTGG